LSPGLGLHESDLGGLGVGLGHGRLKSDLYCMFYRLLEDKGSRDTTVGYSKNGLNKEFKKK